MKARRPTRRLRGNPLLRERIHDPYRAQQKLSESTRCPECGAQYRKGRWLWPRASAHGLKQQLCPACRRTKDHYPAGEIVLSGSFLNEHREEILSRVHHIEELERQEHPLNRIMAIDEGDAEIKISTTDIHLPHYIGHALRDAWGGVTRTHYDLDGYFVRVQWRRGT